MANICHASWSRIVDLKSKRLENYAGKIIFFFIRIEKIFMIKILDKNSIYSQKPTNK